MDTQQDDKELNLLKTGIGFGTAFKATLGFYAAQLVAFLVAIVLLAGVVVVAALVLR